MDYTQLTVWIESRFLVHLIYKLWEQFPKTEQYGLISQMRRSARSVPSNIAQGTGRQYNKERIQFYILQKVPFSNWKHKKSWHLIFDTCRRLN